MSIEVTRREFGATFGDFAKAFQDVELLSEEIDPTYRHYIRQIPNETVIFPHELQWREETFPEWEERFLLYADDAKLFVKKTVIKAETGDFAIYMVGTQPIIAGNEQLAA